MINEAGIHKFLCIADDEINKMAKISHFDRNEDQSSVEICNYLVEIIKSNLNKEVDAYVIGPRKMGLSEGKSEVAIFLDIGQTRFFASRNYQENIKEIKQLEKILSRDSKWKILRINYALPSLSAVFIPIKQRCDLSVTNGFSVQISEMIGHFFAIQPEAVKLYHFIRIWLRINKISFKAFTLTLLVMNFLQEFNLMPSAHNAQKNIQQSFIEGIPVNFDENRDICSYGVKKMTYYFAHVRDFFRYYSNFNFMDNIISTYYGYPVQREEYKPKIDYDSPMCIAAFLNQKCNISRYVEDSQVYAFNMCCTLSYQYLVKNNY